MTTLEALTGRTYGPFVFELSAAKVAEYVAATGDQPDRWTEYAPPSYAGAVLFKTAPAFLHDPDVAPHARLLIHGEQTFAWPVPWRVGSVLTATGSVARIRERNGVAFATFTMEVTDDEANQVLTAKSVFLMSAETPPGGKAEERAEPLPEARGRSQTASPIELPGEGESLPDMAKSASRSDLVRYASASEDFNPMHWDHRTASEAGVGAVICHGLLMAAWACQHGSAVTSLSNPLADARFRFRLPLYPGDEVAVRSVVTGRDGPLASIRSAVVSSAGEHVVATMNIRTGGE